MTAVARSGIRFALVLAAGLILWATATRLSGTVEPWDSPDYGYFYLAALGLSAMFGFAFRNGASLWGPTIVFAQLPIILTQPGSVGPLIGLGILLLLFLSLPAAFVAMLFSHIAVLRRPTY